VKRNGAVLLLIAAAGALAVFFLFPGEEKKVKKQISHFARYFSKEEKENIPAMAGKMRGLELLFTESCELAAPPYSLAGHFSRKEIVNLAARARLHFAGLSLKFHDLSVSFPDRETARVVLTGEAKGKTSGGTPFQDVREMECLLKKEEGRWRFARWEVVEVLKR
jgi:hypothetical protein